MKIIFLIIILAVPASIFTFLKYFGDNKFDVEVFYSDGIEDSFPICEPVLGQYSVVDTLLKSGIKNQVVAFTKSDSKEIINIANRLRDTFDNEFELVLFTHDSMTIDVSNLFTIKSVNDLTKTMNCGFILNNPEQLVLVDKQNRIRGYYSRDLDEIDRLIVELKIIIENDKRIGD